MQIPVRLVVRHTVSELLHNCLLDPIGFLVCLRIVDGVERVFGAQYSPYGVEPLGNQLLPVIV